MVWGGGGGWVGCVVGWGLGGFGGGLGGVPLGWGGGVGWGFGVVGLGCSGDGVLVRGPPPWVGFWGLGSGWGSRGGRPAWWGRLGMWDFGSGAWFAGSAGGPLGWLGGVGVRPPWSAFLGGGGGRVFAPDLVRGFPVGWAGGSDPRGAGCLAGDACWSRCGGWSGSASWVVSRFGVAWGASVRASGGALRPGVLGCRLAAVLVGGCCLVVSFFAPGVVVPLGPRCWGVLLRLPRFARLGLVGGCLWGGSTSAEPNTRP